MKRGHRLLPLWVAVLQSLAAILGAAQVAAQSQPKTTSSGTRRAAVSAVVVESTFGPAGTAAVYPILVNSDGSPVFLSNQAATRAAGLPLGTEVTYVEKAPSVRKSRKRREGGRLVAARPGNSNPVIRTVSAPGFALAAAESSEPSALASTPAARRVLVVLTSFSDRAVGISAQGAKSKMAAASALSSNVTNGLISFESTTVALKLSLPFAEFECSTGLQAIGREVFAFLRSNSLCRGTGGSGYCPGFDHISMWVPTAAGNKCGWGGTAEVGVRRHTGLLSWISVYSPQVIVHELFHNMGARHESCGPNPSTVSREYCEPDIMGTTYNTSSINLPMKALGLGVVPEQAVNTRSILSIPLTADGPGAIYRADLVQYESARLTELPAGRYWGVTLSAPASQSQGEPVTQRSLSFRSGKNGRGAVSLHSWPDAKHCSPWLLSNEECPFHLNSNLFHTMSAVGTVVDPEFKDVKYRLVGFKENGRIAEIEITVGTVLALTPTKAPDGPTVNPVPTDPTPTPVPSPSQPPDDDDDDDTGDDGDEDDSEDDSDDSGDDGSDIKPDKPADQEPKPEKPDTGKPANPTNPTNPGNGGGDSTGGLNPGGGDNGTGPGDGGGDNGGGDDSGDGGEGDSGSPTDGGPGKPTQRCPKDDAKCCAEKISAALESAAAANAACIRKCGDGETACTECNRSCDNALRHRLRTALQSIICPFSDRVVDDRGCELKYQACGVATNGPTSCVGGPLQGSDSWQDHCRKTLDDCRCSRYVEMYGADSPDLPEYCRKKSSS